MVRYTAWVWFGGEEEATEFSSVVSVEVQGGALFVYRANGETCCYAPGKWDSWRTVEDGE